MLTRLLFLILINGVSYSTTKYAFSSHAENVKMFREIRDGRDCLDLQRDINSFVGWCSRNYLNINLSKAKLMAYSRKISTLIFDYTIKSGALSRDNEIKDLGVVPDSSLRFQSRVTHTEKSALRILGVLCRMSQEFRDPRAFVTLYCSLCRPHLEYASVVWGGTSHSKLSRLSRVQEKFLLIFKHRFETYSVPPSINGQ